MNDKGKDSALPRSSPEAAAKGEPSTKKTIDQLFGKLSALYGNKFSDLWTGHDLIAVKATWADGIAELTPDELRAGINELIVNGRAFPPTLPEFFVACRPPLVVPPGSDHHGLDVLAAKLGVSTAGCASYDGLRARLFAEIDKGRRALPAEERLEVRALPKRVAL